MFRNGANVNLTPLRRRLVFDRRALLSTYRLASKTTPRWHAVTLCNYQLTVRVRLMLPATASRVRL